MTKRVRRRTPALLILLLVACGGRGDEGSGGDLPVVVASIYPVGDLVDAIAHDLVRVEVLLPAGVSPATFDVTPRQLRDLESARLFLMIGGGLDEWVIPLAEGHGNEDRVVRLSEGIPLLEGGGHEGAGNPHVWLDPVLVRDRLLPKVREALTQISPEASSTIAQRAAGLADSLTALDEEIRAALSPFSKRAFLSAHAAWSYFAARYGLLEVGVIHRHPGREPSSREMAQLIEEARAHRIECLFVEPQLGEVAARAIATELSLPTCLLDPLGGPNVSEREGYFQLLRFNTRQFVRGLGRGSE